ncbi:MAG: class I SAM-dependent methyltransferase [Candidatus Pacearchaeota archaeon]
MDSYKKKQGYLWTFVTEKDFQLKKFIKIITKENKNFRLKILDIGCGNGKHMILAAKAGLEPYGIDISPIAIKQARKSALKQKVKVNFKVGNALDIKYPKNYFDAVIDFSCFTHIRKPYWNRYFKQVSKVLKPEGYYLLSVWSKNSSNLSEIKGFNPKKSKRKWSVVKRKGLAGMLYSYYFTKKDLVTLLKMKKFKIFLINEVLLRSYAKIMPGSRLKLWFVFCKRKSSSNRKSFT